ncbi:MAG: molecular chaperone DnaK, partial [Dehalococcoidia bacterium]|nr:molecular chaperone DnaK [Dehalococcoidia bacterium]
GKIAAVRSAQQGGDVQYIKRVTQDLSEAMQKLGAAVYQHAGGPASGGGEEPPSDKGDKGDEGTVEGEFREV